MKRFLITLIACIAVIICLSLACVCVSASEAVTGEIVETESENASEGEFEASETVAVTEDGTDLTVGDTGSYETATVVGLDTEIQTIEDTEIQTVEDTELFIRDTDTYETVTEAIAVEDISESETVTKIDGEAISELIEGSESKAQAVMKLAELMGISIEDAEALIDKFIEFGDEHFEESDLWATLKADVETHPDKWIIIALVVLAFVALVVFLIRSTVKNTLTQTNTKLKIGAIESHAAGVEGQVKAQKAELDEIKAEVDKQHEMLGTMLELMTLESKAVESLQANSETSLKVTEESAFQILQLLNIAMDRKVPLVNEAARKLWYQDAVAKIKDRAGITDQQGIADQAGGELHG